LGAGFWVGIIASITIIMPNRLKVLISAYACEPNRGSEQEVGWQWCMQMACFHDVTVITRANNRPPIEAWLQTHSGPRPEFIYHDLGAAWLCAKRVFKAHQWYYHFWQRSLPGVIAPSQKRRPFDLLHHVTFASFRHTVGLAGLGAPWIWGPVGGVESVPASLLPYGSWVDLISESSRNFANSSAAIRVTGLRQRLQTADRVLASTLEMQTTIEKLGFAAQLMPTIGLDIPVTLPSKSQRAKGPLRTLYVGRLVYWKGISLAIEAIAQGPVGVTLAVMGGGPFERAARKLAANLGLQSRVTFLGHKNRDQVLASYVQYDLLLYPSLHDSGGYVVIEAMLSGLPVVCLNSGGPAIAVGTGRGFKIDLGPRHQVVHNLAVALRQYDANPELLRQHGVASQAFVAKEYDWQKKAEQMNMVYQQVYERYRDSGPSRTS
jgi:glycosyltransferase involved in cell wall biosynthesis